MQTLLGQGQEAYQDYRWTQILQALKVIKNNYEKEKPKNQSTRELADARTHRGGSKDPSRSSRDS